MTTMVRYFPLDSKYKRPIGGVKVGASNYFRIEFSRPPNPDNVYIVITKDGETPVKYEMEFHETTQDGYAAFELELTITSKGLYFYHFEVETATELTTFGCGDNLVASDSCTREWQLTVYQRKTPAPSWIKGGMIYQIMPDRFYNGGKRNKTKDYAVYRTDWAGTPAYEPDENGKILNNDFFGGNIKGITKKLLYLKGLGVNCIYLNPIFEARSNHKYDTGNYRKIDPDFGNIDDLKELIAKAGKKGIKIILDGVFSHTGDDSIYFNKYNTYDSIGAYQSEFSPYASWYKFNKFPDEYESWWGIDILPNTQEEDVYFNEFINGEEGVIRSWTELGLGGWRLDVVDELPDVFLDNLTRAAKAKDSEVMVLGEVWEDASNKESYSQRRRYLLGDQLDSVTNYPFKEDIINFVLNKDAEKLANTVHTLINNYPKDQLDSLMNLLGTHDTVRILTALGDSGKTETRENRAKAKLTNKKAAFERLKLATVLQYTLLGVPCVYYGDEAGMEGFEDPFNRRCYNWAKQDKNFLKWYRALGRIRSENKHVYAEGDFKLISAKDGMIAYSRVIDGESMVTIVNNSDNTVNFDTGFEYVNLLTKKPFVKVEPNTAYILKRADLIVKKTRKPKAK